ncbi:hypothetical protein MKW98_018235 [Papaver atlanticum]|uniref:Cytochrome P450 n=1 Tax=Papaver atlanticum TaxID=357466 RepID=A0AAD4X7I5_9MAGN|nr:hypothetical protein MKW98_018235 [Papaver atlanticum]
MGVVEIPQLVLFSFPVGVFGLYLLLILIKFIHKVWWNPIQITKILSSQGIKGPPYKFLHGNTKEIYTKLYGTRSKPMTDLSHQIFPYIQPFQHSCIKDYGKNFLCWIGSKPQLFITEVELVKEILNNKDGAYPKWKAEGYHKKLLGDGLATAEGNKWVRQRKLANHAFHADGLKGMVPAMIESVEIMVEKWKEYEGKEIEVFNEFRIMTSEVISRTAFGSSYAEGKNIFEMLVKLGSLISANFLKIRLPVIRKLMPSEEDAESDRLEREIRKSIIGLIKTREEKVKRGELEGGYGNDYLGVLVKAFHESDDNKKISVDDMVDECKTFYFAGHETTTSLLTWTCLLLAIHTEWQDKARKEVFELLGENKITADDNFLGKLKIMNMIINETLRLYPPVVALSRRVGKKVNLGNKIILPANIEVSVSTLAFQHNPDIWGADVHLFKPERFSEGIVKATNNNSMAFSPFGLGPRFCVGSNFAITEAKIALVMILQRFHFTLSPAYIHSPSQRITTRPQHGLQIMLHAL